MGPESPKKEQGGSAKPDRLRREDVSEARALSKAKLYPRPPALTHLLISCFLWPLGWLETFPSWGGNVKG